MKWICSLLFLIVLPASADAQSWRDRGGRDRNAFSMEPYVGVYFDPVVAEGHGPGPLVGIRLGYDLWDRVRLVADLGYSEVNGAGVVSSDEDASTLFTYGNDWFFTLGGLELFLVPGETAGSLSLLGGVGWRRNEVEQRVVGSAPEPEVGGFGSFGILAPGATLSHELGSGAAVRVSFHDYIVDFDDDPEHAPVLTLGVRFR